MRHFIIAAALLLLPTLLVAQRQETPAEQRAEVTMQTTQGKIVLALYNETPLHRDNFLRHVRRGFYDGLLFHRIIRQFMIQGGDSISRNVTAQEYEPYDGPESEPTVPAEFRFPELYHRRGVLAAAREGDEVNPTRASSASQFYIVWGKYHTPKEMNAAQERIDDRPDSTLHFTFPQEIRDAYELHGGTPHLDGAYTVFGEVIKGLEVVGSIQAVKTDSLDRPLKDVRIKKAWVSKEL